MPGSIPRTPVITMVTDPDGSKTEVDISCFVRRWTPSQDQEETDISTFCAPGATDLGKITNSAVMTVLWTPAAQTALDAAAGAEVELQIKIDTADTEAWLYRARWANLPPPAVEPGVPMEVDVPVAILATPTYGTPAA